MGGQGSTGPQGQPQQITGGTPSGVPNVGGGPGGGGFIDTKPFTGFGDMGSFMRGVDRAAGLTATPTGQPTPQQGGMQTGGGATQPFGGGAGQPFTGAGVANQWGGNAQMAPQPLAGQQPQQGGGQALQNYFQNFRPQAQANPTAGAPQGQQFQAPTAAQNANPYFGGYAAMGGTGGRR